jgi:hypothetical protein
MAAPFTYGEYRNLVRNYRAAGYCFSSFPQSLENNGCSKLTVLMRHDVDFDLAAARRMAELEREEGVQSTYFFLLTTEHYNVLSRRGTADVQAILALGHHLGLHFDCAAYSANSSEQSLRAACLKEALLLGEWFGREVEIISYHRPSPLVLTGNPALSAPLPHTYTARFMKDFRYCSDSRGEWRFGDPRSTAEFSSRSPMHILIHPIWWNSNRKQPRQSLTDWLSRRTELLEQSTADNCAVYQRNMETGGER